MPPRDRDGVFHRAEQTLRDATITFENGRRLEVPEIRATSIELDEPNEIPITNIGAQEANFSMEGIINSFIEALNAVWGKMSDDFELADEEEYLDTDPISFDELMGGYCGDN